MSLRVEWCNAKHADPEIEEPGKFEDAYGYTNDLPCLLLGQDTVFAIEGSIEALRQLVMDIQDAINAYEERNKQRE